MKSKRRGILERMIAPGLALAVLTGFTVQRLSYATPQDAESYHQRVRQAIEGIPREIGDWKSTDIPIVEAATRLLQPNAILSRRYVDAKSHRSVNLLVVHCRSARDMGGHYPPICYPAHGWEGKNRDRITWELGEHTSVQGAEYEFTRHLAAMRVVNLLVMPDGTVTGDIAAVRKAASDYLNHFYGAGQVQLVFAGHTTAAERDNVLGIFSGAVRHIIRAIDRGVKK